MSVCKVLQHWCKGGAWQATTVWHRPVGRVVVQPCAWSYRTKGGPGYFHWSTQAMRELANIFYKLKTTPRDWAKTSLDELDKVERHFNQRKLVLEWFGIRVLAPECEEDGEVIWHLRKNTPEVLLTVGIYDGHVFLIKDINRLARTYVCNDCQACYKNCISWQETAWQHHYCTKMLMFRFQWASVTCLNVSPRISVTPTQKSWSGSLWRPTCSEWHKVPHQQTWLLSCAPQTEKPEKQQVMLVLQNQAMLDNESGK